MANSEGVSTRTIMQACIGSIENFVPEEGADFEEYLERLDHFFSLNGISDDEKKRSAFITLAGQVCLQKLKAKIQPQKVTEKTYKEICEIMKSIFSPKKSTIAERFKFYERSQKEGESVNDYVGELQMLARTCKFEAFLSSALRDKLVCGLRNPRIQARLLDDDKTFEETLKTAVAMELADENVKLMKPSSSSSAIVAKISRKNLKRDRSRSNAESSGERERSTRKERSTIRCFRCGKWGNHMAAECRVRVKQGKKGREKTQKSKKSIKAVEEDIDSTDTGSDSDRLGNGIRSMLLGGLLQRRYIK